MNSVVLRDRALELLKARGIELEVGGCGCCDSPWVKIVVDGEVILDDSGMNMPVSDSERERQARYEDMLGLPETKE